MFIYLYKLERFFQRIFRGWDDSDLWSIDYAFSKWFLEQYNQNIKFKNEFLKLFPIFLLIKSDDSLDCTNFENYKILREEREKEIDNGINELIKKYKVLNEYGIVDWFLPRLKRFKKIAIGYPTTISLYRRYYNLNLNEQEEKDLTERSFKQWKQIIDKIILSLELLKMPFYYFDETSLRDIKKGLQYFRKYFRALWD